MPRPIRKREINARPRITYFKPAGISLKQLDEIILFYEELEAMRLKDLVGKSQDESAEYMGISQPTFHRLLNRARKKIVEALLNGKAIRVKGGHYTVKEEESNEIIAISASSKDLDGDVAECFGGCQFFLIITLKHGILASYQSIGNPNIEIRGNLGTAVAQMLADHHVHTIISGNIGFRAMEVFQQFGISTLYAKGSLRRAIQDYIENKLN